MATNAYFDTSFIGLHFLVQGCIDEKQLIATMLVDVYSVVKLGCLALSCFTAFFVLV